MDTHYHIWYYRRDPEGTIRSMERDDHVYPTRRKANYALSDGRQYWKAGQVLQCVDGAFCQPLPEEMVDRGMPFGPKYVALEQLEEQAKSIRPAVKHVKAMKHRDRTIAKSGMGVYKGREVRYGSVWIWMRRNLCSDVWSRCRIPEEPEGSGIPFRPFSG